jgi:hypothetical protein
VVRVAINVHSELQIMSAFAWQYTTLFSCNPTMVWVAIDMHSELQVLSRFAWYYTPSVATGQWFELQLIYTPSCKYWVLPSDTIPPLELQCNSASSCNWYTLRVANTECFRLILYYPFNCNPTMVRVVIDIQSKLQILSASAWPCTTHSVATR